MKILTTQEIRESDAYTIKNEPIKSIDLMERAAVQLFHAFTKLYPVPQKVIVFAGPGNNGGDGIALSRLLAENGYPVDLNILDLGNGLSPDASENEKRLSDLSWLNIFRINEKDKISDPAPGDIIIDALFGSGLSRPIKNLPAQIVKLINGFQNDVISIDIPSGLYGEDNSDNPFDAVIKAKVTLSLHSAKFAFMMPENNLYVGRWMVLPIGLDEDFLGSLKGLGYVSERENLRAILKKRRKFDHKGVFGHALLIAGSNGKMGAAALAARACLSSGVGLLSCHIPSKGQQVIHSFVPEAMLSVDEEKYDCSVLPDLNAFDAVAAGPGLATGQKQFNLMKDLLEKIDSQLILDADAINILAENPELIEKLPAKTILTPHPGEYKRLFGEDENHFARLQRLKEICHQRKIIVILKGAHTAVVLPDKEIWFNNTGNPGMATAGSGDVLTGIVLSLLAQGYTPEDAAILAVFLHGSAGDKASDNSGEEALLASDIIDKIGQAFNEIS